jgi:inosose dehydratase
VDLEQDPAGFAAMLAEADLQIASIPYYCEFEKGVDPDKIRTAVEKTAAAGGKKILAIPGFLDEKYPHALENMAEGLKLLCQVAAEFDIKVSLEDFDNIKSPCATAEGLQDFFARIPALKFNLDTGNFRYMDQDVTECCLPILDRLALMHLKDRSQVPMHPAEKPLRSLGGTDLYPCPVGEGMIPMEQVLALAADAGYDGYCTVEHFDAADQWDYITRSARWFRNWSSSRGSSAQ